MPAASKTGADSGRLLRFKAAVAAIGAAGVDGGRAVAVRKRACFGENCGFRSNVCFRLHEISGRLSVR